MRKEAVPKATEWSLSLFLPGFNLTKVNPRWRVKPSPAAVGALDKKKAHVPFLCVIPVPCNQ